MKPNDKTNVMRVLDSKKIAYESHSYDPDPTLTGAEIATTLGETPEKVFKTLVTQGKSGAYYVFAIPVEAELDLKKAAKASGEKAVSMLKQKDLLPLTGYVHGGCSPVGMKKLFLTVVDKSIKVHKEVIISGGRLGSQILLSPDDLIKVTRARVEDITA